MSTASTKTFDAKAYRAAIDAAFTTPGELLLTPDVLLEMAEKADAEEKELSKEFPPGTVHDRRNLMYQVTQCALKCAEWLERQECKALSFVGPFGPVMPRRGQQVVIRKGSRVFGFKVPDEGILTARNQTIKVNDCDRGYVDWYGIAPSGKEFDFRQAKVTWAGTGGYWRWTDANNLLLMVPATAALAA